MKMEGYGMHVTAIITIITIRSLWNVYGMFMECLWNAYGMFMEF